MTDTAPTPQEQPPDDADGSPQPPPAQGGQETGAPAGAAPPGAPGAEAGGEGPAKKPASGTPDSGQPEEKRSVEEIAADYLIPISDMAIEAWKDKPEAYLPYAVETAKGLYPTLTDKLSTGLTTKVLVDPYVQVAKQILGPGAEPNFMDPKWEKALDGGRDPKTGNPTLMALSAWRQLLQTDPSYGYDRSPQSHDQADNLANTINGVFTGAVPTPQQPSVPSAPAPGPQNEPVTQ